MSGFSADWLTLREPYDLRARNPAVLDAVAASLEPLSSVRIVDLACGTGSTLRALSPHLPARQNWKLIDNDLGLLARATATPLAKHATVTAVPLDLNRDLEAALDGAVDLVTTSALLDLVSETWLDRLAVEIAARAIPLYAALSYDGRIAFTPSDPFDAAIAAAVNAHQRTDKGFGPALGPAAAAFAIARFEALGYSRGPRRVRLGDGTGRSRHANRNTGRMGKRRARYRRAVARRHHGLAHAPPRRDCRRTSSLLVGHVDFFATPSATR